MVLDYEAIDVSPNAKFGCDVYIAELTAINTNPNGDKLANLFMGDDKCVKDPSIPIELTSQFGPLEDWRLKYTADNTKLITVLKPVINVSLQRIEFFLSKVIPSNPRLEPIKQDLIKMLNLNKESGEIVVKVDDEFKIDYIKPLPRTLLLHFCKFYVKALLKLFLSKEILNHLETKNTNYLSYRSSLMDGIGSIDDIYANILNCTSVSNMTNVSGKIQIKIYRETLMIPKVIPNGAQINLVEGGMRMFYHQFLYHAMSLALHLDKLGFLPPGYFYINSPQISLPSVEIQPVAIKNPSNLNGQNISYIAEKIDNDTRAIIENNYSDELNKKVEILKQKLDTIGTDSSIAINLKTDIENLKTRIENTAQIDQQNILKKQLKDLMDKFEIENEANKVKAELVEKSLLTTKQQLEEQIKLEQNTKLQLKNNIDTLKNQLQTNSDLDMSQKEKIDEQISILKKRLEQEEIEDTEEKKLLKNKFDILKNELDKTKEALSKQSNDSFMEKYGIIIISIISVVIVLILILVMYLLMK